MGDIGPAQQRFEVLPVPVLTTADVLRRPVPDRATNPENSLDPSTRDDSSSQH
jgi:hypothetical protein